MHIQLLANRLINLFYLSGESNWRLLRRALPEAPAEDGAVGGGGRLPAGLRSHPEGLERRVPAPHGSPTPLLDPRHRRRRRLGVGGQRLRYQIRRRGRLAQPPLCEIPETPPQNARRSTQVIYRSCPSSSFFSLLCMSACLSVIIQLQLFLKCRASMLWKKIAPDAVNTTMRLVANCPELKSKMQKLPRNKPWEVIPLIR